MLKELFNRFTGSLGSNLQPQFPNATVDAEAIKGYNGSRKLPASSKGSFCYAPGINMLFGQDGKIKACCHNMEFTLGEYPQQSITEIWRGKAAEELRGHMKNFDLGHGCEVCALDMNTHSYEEVRARHFDSLPYSKHYPTMMEFLMTNTCNLECVMCKGMYSSLIRQNREKLPPLVSPYDKDFLKQLEEFIPHLHETRFSGSGEAFAIDMNYEIWEMIIRLNPGCIIMVQTNGSFLNARIKDLLSRGNFRIGVSLDSLKKDVFESIRIHANFDRIMENIRYFSEYSRNKNEKFALALCVMRQNWSELPAFINFCNANNAVATLHKVWYPEEFGLHTLSFKELSEIYAYLSPVNLPAENRLQQLNKRHYNYFVSVVKGWKESAFKRSDVAPVVSAPNNVDQWRARTLKDSDESSYVNALNENALMPYLQEKLKSALEDDGATPPEIADIVKACGDKLLQVLQNYEAGEERLNIFKQICKIPAPDVLKSLRHLPVETLTEQARTFLVVN